MGMRVPPPGTRGSSSMTWARRLFSPMFRLQVAQYRHSRATGQPKLIGLPALLLTTVGRRSGRERTVPLGGFEDGPDAWLVVGSAGGGRQHPAWFLNMAAHPEQIWVEVGRRRLRVEAELLEGERRKNAYQRLVGIFPRYQGYQAKTDREVPVVRLTPAE
ncbi:MAG: nitroreductase/quinone reductase family protein [Candidatus Dormibacteria bacterium]